MGRIAPLLFALAVLMALLAAPSPASGQSAADVALARELFREGSRLAKEGDWEQARDRYERSLALKRAAITLYSLGIAQQHTGQLVEALESLRAFLAAEKSEATEAYVDPAREAIGAIEPRVARAVITIAPSGLAELQVSLDGKPIPLVALGRARLVNPGTHELSASAAGHEDGRTGFSVEEGASTEVRLELRPKPDEPPPAPPVVPTEPELALPIVLLSAGGAVIITGVAVGLAGVSQASDATYQDDEDADAARTKAIVGDVLVGVGVAAAAVGGVLLLTELLASDDAPSREGAALRPWAHGSVGGLEVVF